MFIQQSKEYVRQIEAGIKKAAAAVRQGVVTVYMGGGMGGAGLFETFLPDCA